MRTFFWPIKVIVGAALVIQASVAVSAVDPVKQVEIAAAHSRPGLKPDLPANLLTRKPRGMAPGLRIAVSEVMAARELNREIILVDVRRPEEFEKFRVPGALNIPLHLVKTKSFLKSKPVVLLNEGYGYVQLEEEQKRLTRLGFKQVSILEGGLNAWQQAAAPLEGDPFAIRKLAEISPKSYFLDRNFTHWLAIDASPSPNPERPLYIPEAVSIPYSGNDAAFLGEIRRRTAGFGNMVPHLLVFDDSGERSEAILRLAKEAHAGNFYYLQGGLPAYKLFLQQQVLMRHPRKMQSGSEVCQNCR